MTRIARHAFVPSLEIVLFILVFYLSLYLMPDMLNSDGILGRHVTVGEYILETRTIPSHDVFSHTRFGAPLVLHEWLSEVIYALAHRTAGLNGVAWLTALVLAIIYLTLAVGLRLLGVSAPFAFAAALAAFLTGMIHHLPRPHLFTLLLFTVFVLLLESFRRQDTKPPLTSLFLWPCVPSLVVMTLWANLNGAFVLGFLMIGIYIVGAVLDRRPRHAVIFFSLLASSFVACLINPFGLTLPQHVFGFMGNRFLVDNTVEYLSPNFHNISAWLFAGWIVLSIVLLGRLTTLVSWTGLLLLGAWTAFGLYSARNIANYAQVAAIVIAPLAQVWLLAAFPPLHLRLDNLDRVAPVGGGWAWGIVVVALLIFFQTNGIPLDARAEGNVFTNRAFPVDAVDSLQGNPLQGKMFNEYTWGGYLEYRMFPTQRVFIDGDNDFFGEGLVREYLQVINAREGWESVLERYEVDWLIIPPMRPLARELSRSRDWGEVYRDDGTGIWVRR